MIASANKRDRIECRREAVRSSLSSLPQRIGNVAMLVIVREVDDAEQH
jgi:hypothetical protein